MTSSRHMIFFALICQKINIMQSAQNDSKIAAYIMKKYENVGENKHEKKYVLYPLCDWSSHYDRIPFHSGWSVTGSNRSWSSDYG